MDLSATYRRAVWSQYKKDLRSTHVQLHIFLGLAPPCLTSLLTLLYLISYGPPTFAPAHEILVPLLLEALGFAVPIAFYLFYMLGGARRKVYEKQQREIQCLNNKIKALTPTEPALTVALECSSNTCALIITNAGGVADIAVRLIEATGFNPGLRAGEKFLPLRGDMSHLTLRANTGPLRAHVASWEAVARTPYLWTLSYLEAGRIFTTYFQSSMRPGTTVYNRATISVAIESTPGGIRTLFFEGSSILLILPARSTYI
jgi:hypothetical protein